MKNFPMIVIALAALAGTSLSCFAQEDAPARPCNPAMLKGTYLLTISGTRPAPRIAAGVTGTPGTPEAVVGVVLHVFDGKGGFVQAAPSIVKGALSGLFPDQLGTGTYEVRANCSGAFTVNIPQLPAPLENQMVLYDNGRRFKALVSSPQALMIAVEGTRID